MRSLRHVLVAVFLASLPACGISTPSDNTEDKFSDTISTGGVKAFNFSSGTGEFSIRITALSPDQGTALGLFWGQPSGSSCNAFLGYLTNLATLNGNPLTGPINKGTYCVGVFDSGLVKATQTFTVTVSHPKP